jgi:hypothetical protein
VLASVVAAGCHAADESVSIGENALRETLRQGFTTEDTEFTEDRGEGK